MLASSVTSLVVVRLALDRDDFVRFALVFTRCGSVRSALVSTRCVSVRIAPAVRFLWYRAPRA